MAVAFNNFMNWMSSGEIMGIPAMIFVMGIGHFIFIIYLIITRKPKLKEYQAIILAKKVREDLDLQYKFFGNDVGVPLMEGTRNLGHVIGMMEMVWNERKKRYESLALSFDKKIYASKLQEISMEMFKKAFKNLGEDEKKSVRLIAKEDMKNELILKEQAKTGEKVVVKGTKKEIEYDKPIDIIALKVCKGKLGKLVAAFMPKKAIYFIFKKGQISLDTDAVVMSPGLQPQPYYYEMIFCTAAREMLDNTGFKIERENIMQETANQIPRTVFFDTAAAQRATFLRENAEIEAKKFKSQKEGHQD